MPEGWVTLVNHESLIDHKKSHPIPRAHQQEINKNQSCFILRMCVHLLLNMCPLCRARRLALQIETSINQTEKKREAAIE